MCDAGVCDSEADPYELIEPSALPEPAQLLVGPAGSEHTLVCFDPAEWPAILRFLGWSWERHDIDSGPPDSLRLDQECSALVPFMLLPGAWMGRDPDGGLYPLDAP